MDAILRSSGQPPRFNFRASLGLAQRAHDFAAALPGADVFSQLKLDRVSIARELPSLAGAPAPAPSYTSVPIWKIWQDF